jgi:demethylmenaquinone methyltransferase/2-methoxy-6-polyprenyl-1,4-benzoquinol methylase
VLPDSYRLADLRSENYRLLGFYTERFQDCEPVVKVMRDAGFNADLASYFHGCATGVVARKPIGEEAS